MFKQFWLLFCLKWTLSKRSLSKSPVLSYAIILFYSFMGLGLAGGLAILLYALGVWMGQNDSPYTLLLHFDSLTGLYCILYLWSFMWEIQRPDIIDFKKMLHLPLSLPLGYLMNVLISFFRPIHLCAVPALLGLFVGLFPVLGKGVYVFGLIFALPFLFMMNAWSYYLRGVMAMVMGKLRWRRSLLVILAIFTMLISQVPLAFLYHLPFELPILTASLTPDKIYTFLIPLNCLCPFLWPAFGLWSFLLGERKVAGTLCLIGIVCLTILGILLGYRSTYAYYMDDRRAKENSRVTTPEASIPSWRKLPFLGEDRSMLTWCFYKSYARNTQIRLLTIIPVCFVATVLVLFKFGMYGQESGELSDWFPIAALLWPFINFSAVFFNLFGMDADSFPALMLLPVRRHKYLLAKNLALSPFVLGLVVFLIISAAVITKKFDRGIFLMVALAVHLFLVFCMVGNQLSVRLPYRMSQDALRLPAQRLQIIVTTFISSLFSCVLVVPTILCMVFIKYYDFTAEISLEWHFEVTLVAVLVVLTFLLYLKLLFYTGDLLIIKETQVYEKLFSDKE